MFNVSLTILLLLAVTTIDCLQISKNAPKVTTSIEKNAFYETFKLCLFKMKQDQFDNYLHYVKSSQLNENFIKLVNWLELIDCNEQINHNESNKQIIFALNWTINVILLFALAYIVVKSKV
uniref:Secreted protein n=1 Tax=Panstrongylus lignarius TaxID=156445 RepID=A0A224Y0F6_9HEMI